jgi:hypothetical protein
VSDTIFLPVPGQTLRVGFNPASCPYAWSLYELDYNDEFDPPPGVVAIDLYWTTQGYWVEQSTQFDPWNDSQHVKSWRVLDRDYALSELIKKDATIPPEVAPPEEVVQLRAGIKGPLSVDTSPTRVPKGDGPPPPPPEGPEAVGTATTRPSARIPEELASIPKRLLDLANDIEKEGRHRCVPNFLKRASVNWGDAETEAEAKAKTERMAARRVREVEISRPDLIKYCHRDQLKTLQSTIWKDTIKPAQEAIDKRGIPLMINLTSTRAVITLRPEVGEP